MIIRMAINTRIAVLSALIPLASQLPSRAVSITGGDWRVHFNLPDQNSSFGSVTPDEYAIRNALTARIDALQTNHRAWLATYTFSGSNTVIGGAGAVVVAMEGALNRGASVAFIADGGINLATQNGGTNSLLGLSTRAVNPLQLVQDDSASGIMHDKLGVFDYGSTNKWLFVTSWNFTGGASIFQWNIGLELRSPELFSIYTNEFAELLAGRFHDHPDKSHAHDGQSFVLPESSGSGFVRFSPYPSDTVGGNNAERDITNWIAGARQQIVFALNKLTRGNIATSLVQAANRGVSIDGVMPRSDTDTGADSANIYSYLTNTTSYVTTNRIRFWRAFATADYSASDTGQTDLVHAKYMVIDPFGTNPALIHGSANWTASALVYKDENDENLLFLRHRDIARMFYAHFKRITGAFQQENDFWINATASNVPAFSMWMTDSNAYIVESATSVTGSWGNWQMFSTGRVGFASITNDPTPTQRYFRARRP